jgi:hypothetical protein
MNTGRVPPRYNPPRMRPTWRFCCRPCATTSAMQCRRSQRHGVRRGQGRRLRTRRRMRPFRRRAPPNSASPPLRRRATRQAGLTSASCCSPAPGRKDILRHDLTPPSGTGATSSVKLRTPRKLKRGSARSSPSTLRIPAWPPGRGREDLVTFTQVFVGTPRGDGGVFTCAAGRLTLRHRRPDRRFDDAVTALVERFLPSTTHG